MSIITSIKEPDTSRLPAGTLWRMWRTEKASEEIREWDGSAWVPASEKALKAVGISPPMPANPPNEGKTDGNR